MWRIYYSTGTFDSTQGLPQDAPAFDIQVIVQPDDVGKPDSVGRELLRLHDWYYWREDEGKWAGGDLLGVLDLLLHRQPIKALCQGRRIPADRFNQIYRQAKADPDFPPKSADRIGEHP